MTLLSRTKSMKSKNGAWKLTVLAVFAAIFAAGCSMTKTTELVSSRAEFGCDGSAGAYFLAKSVVAVKIKREGNDVTMEHVTTQARPDEGHGYCIDYKGSPTANDFFEVKRNQHGLLTAITTEAEDKSREILETVIDTVFDGIAAGSVRAASAPRLAAFPEQFNGEFDPFDPWDTAITNDALREFGLCMMVEGAVPFQHTRYEAQKLTHGGGSDRGLTKGRAEPSIGDEALISRYCDNPLGVAAAKAKFPFKGSGWKRELGIERSHAYRHDRMRVNGLERTSVLARLHKPYRWGVLYRPRLSHAFLVYSKERPDLEASRNNPWILRYRKIVRMENAAPILAIGVDRTFFADRKTTLRFDLGMLTDVEIAKGAELEGAIKVPLAVAENIVELPTKIVQLKLDRTNNRRALIEAQTDLIKLETARNNRLSTLNTTTLSLQQNQAFLRAALAGQRPNQSRVRTANSLGFRDESSCMAQCLAGATDQQSCINWCSCALERCIPQNLGLNACTRYEVCQKP